MAPNVFASMPPHPYEDVARDLAGTPFASVRYVAETASTNADAAALLGDRNAAGLTIVAEHQTQGAGRKGRSWLAQPGTSLLFTTILPEALPAASIWAVPFWVALAVGPALLESGIEVSLHWPNDLLLAGKKLAGILCVSRVAGETAWVACGVGINVYRTAGMQSPIEPSPAFCSDVVNTDRASLLLAILRAYYSTFETLRNPARIARLWETQARLPQRYRILKDGATAPFEATALSLASGGGLVVQRDDGTRETIAIADARALR